MAQTEALALIGAMLQGEPAARGTVADLLRHPFWLDATEKLEGVRRRPRKRGVHHPPPQWLLNSAAPGFLGLDLSIPSGIPMLTIQGRTAH